MWLTRSTLIASAAILLVVSSVFGEKEMDKHVEDVIPLSIDINGQVDANVHASQSSEAKSIGGGLVLQHDNGVTGAVDVTYQLGAGTKLDLGASVPLLKGAGSNLAANVHGSQVLGVPKAQAVGGGLLYTHDSGVFGSVDATHHKGMGNVYKANVGHSFDAGPGTLSFGAGAVKYPRSSRVHKQIGVNYRIEF